MNKEYNWKDVEIRIGGEKIEYVPGEASGNKDITAVIDWDMPMQQTIINDFYKRTRIEWEEKLKSYLKKNLREFGYEFLSDEDFIKFCKERVVRIGFEDRPNYYEFYLDYVNQENTGHFIGNYSEKVEIVNEGNKIMMFIGRDF